MNAAPGQMLQESLRLLQAGQVDAADGLLRRLRDSCPHEADVWRLSGAAAQARGDLPAAETYLREAIRLRPSHHEASNALGLVLSRQGRVGQAREVWEQTLAMAPQQAAAAINLARSHLDAGDPQKAAGLVARHAGRDPLAALVHAQALRAGGDPARALDAYQRRLQLVPGDIKAAFGIALCCIDLGRAEEGLERLESLPAGRDPQIEYARFSALARMGHLDAAQKAVETVLSLNPGDLPGLEGAAQLLCMTSRPDKVPALFARALEATGFALPVELQYIDTLVRMGEFDAARSAVDAAGKRHGVQPALLDRAIAVEVEAADSSRAFTLAQQAGELFPAEASLLANRVRAAFMAGDARHAAPLIDQAMKTMPEGRFWTAMEATLARLSDDADTYETLCGPQLVMTSSLQPPPAYGGIENFNMQLAEFLRGLHAFSAAPLGQSLRDGTQTSSDLRHNENRLIVDFFSMVEQAFDRYRARLKPIAGHPLLGNMPDRMHVQGAWSVRLGPNGRHVNHVHPEGWVSCVYYVSVPPQIAGSSSQEGWLKFGEPPFAVPGLGPHDHVEPRPGELTIFPSYLWHGTVPISSGERLTIAFDIAPGSGRGNA
ncbi:2OG-Fe(II) oxygenase family protein [Glycocaulis sp.]|uniref:2OG-Fe(II) oxygenase family protein n=1 Tax=Glycocaulis sp. TaxID=1969725 RepID=UPI003D1CBF84